MGQLDDRIAIITGGASGIGAATARLFVAEGACVVIGDRDRDRGAALAAEFGNAARFADCDVRREESVAALVALAQREFGGLDILCNNAGLVAGFGRIEDVDSERFAFALDVMVKGPFYGIKHAAPLMKRSGRGSIITTASIAAFAAGYGTHAYAAAKHAVLGLTRSVATDLGRFGIRVNAVCPGGVVTPMNVNAMGGSPQAEAATVEYLKQMQPIARAGQPTDIAAAFLYLASDASSFVNGAALVVDGGALAGRPWNPMFETLTG